jgi:peroxiredoxin
MRISSTTLLAIALLAFSACGPESAQVSGSALEGSHVDFRLASITGDQLGPGDFRGQIVVFDFWATWCRPCHVQADILASIYEEFDRLGVAFVAASLGESASTVEAFTDKRPFPYPVLIDPADEVSNRLGIYVLPTVMILDGEGRVIYLQEGVSSARRLRTVLEGALEEARTASL